MRRMLKTAKSIGFIVFLSVILMASVIPVAYAGTDSGVSITQAPEITMDGREYVFDVSANVTTDVSANVVVATYDKDKNMINASIERLNSAGNAIVYVMSDTTEASYKMFVFDRDIELKPLCPSYEGTLSYAEYSKVSFSSRDVKDWTSETAVLEVYIDPSTSSKSINYKMSTDAKLYINHSTNDYLADTDFTPSAVSDVFKTVIGDGEPEDVTLTLSDSDFDNRYDIINAEYYIYGTVTDIDGDKVYIDDTCADLAKGTNVILQNEDGSTLIAPSVGDEVAVMADSCNDISAYNDYIKIIKLNNAFVGIIEETYSSGNKYYYVINGSEYAGELELEVSDYGVFYKTLTNKIYRFDAIDPRPKGYILEAAMEESGFSNTLKVKLLTEDNTIEEYKVGGSGTDYLTEHLGLSSENPNLSFVNNAEYAKRFIAYNPASSTQFNSYEATATSIEPLTGIYDSETNSIGTQIFEHDVPVFCIGVTDADLAESMNITELTDDKEYSGQLLCNTDGEVVAYILLSGEYTAPEAEVVSKQIYVLGLTSTGLTDVWQVQYVSEDGGVDTKNVREAITDEFLSCLGVDGSFAYDNTEISANKLLNVEIAGNRIVTVSKADETISELNGIYTAGKIGDTTISQSAVVYDLTSSLYKTTCASDIGYLTDGTEYEGYISADSDVYIITKSTYRIAVENNLAIITKRAILVDEGQYQSYESSGTSRASMGGSGMNSAPNIRTVTQLTYVQDETEKTAILSNNINLVASSIFDVSALKQGDVVQIVVDANGVIQYCAVVGTINGSGLLDYDTDVVSEIKFEDTTTEYVYGYIQNDAKYTTNKGETLTLNCGGTETVNMVVRDATNKYTYNDAGRIIKIETGDFMAEDAYYLEVTDEDNNKAEVTYVLLKSTDDIVTDIYSFNSRVEIDWNN